MNMKFAYQKGLPLIPIIIKSEICLDLPKESPINSILGRDVLDLFKVCLDGKKGEITFLDP